jgi:hypothetical protein
VKKAREKYQLEKWLPVAGFQLPVKEILSSNVATQASTR